MEPVVRALVFLLSAVLAGSAGYILVLTLRAKHPYEDWPVVATHVVLRGAAGLAALWLALGGGSPAGWTLVGLLVAQPIWAEVMRRRRAA
jgi:branched-subunit amino acid ABC-type transport system permease component